MMIQLLRRILFRINLIQPRIRNGRKLFVKLLVSKLLVVASCLMLLQDELEHWIKKKRLRKQFLEGLKQGKLRGGAVCLVAMQKYPLASKWQGIKDNVRNYIKLDLSFNYVVWAKYEIYNYLLFCLPGNYLLVNCTV